MAELLEIASLPITTLGPLLRERELSPVELLDAALQRIEAVEPQLNAYISLFGEAALEQARQSEREIASGHYRGPLHGVPIGLKDLLWTKGHQTTAGSAVLRDHVPSEDATVVARLREAGAVFIGKHNLHEFAYGVTNNNATFGPAHNPWNTARIPGGSSGGTAAAVAAAECAGGVGSDTGGSIRIPAACCGVVGLMPTYGRVSRYGAVPLSWSLDHLGPITRTVADAALMLSTIAGYDPKDVSTQSRPVPDYTRELDGGIGGLRMGIPREYFFDSVDAEVKLAIERAIDILTKLGAVPMSVSLPYVEHSILCQYLIVLAEATAYHERLLAERVHLYSPELRLFLEAGETVTAPQYLKAQRLRTLIKESFVAASREADFLVTPTLPCAPPPIGDESITVGGRQEPVANALIRFTCPIDLSGQPAISVPCGFTSDGLPIGLQIIGRPFEEAHICRVAHTFLMATEWHSRKLPL